MAAQLGEALRIDYGDGKVDIYSSPFIRSVRTACVVCDRLSSKDHISKVKIEDGLCELLNPQWYKGQPSFKPISDLSKEFGNIDTCYQAMVQSIFPETWLDARSRVEETLDKVIAQSDCETIVMVGHGVSVVAATLLLQGLHEDVLRRAESLAGWNMCGITKFVWSESSWKMIVESDVSFMDDELQIKAKAKPPGYSVPVEGVF